MTKSTNLDAIDLALLAVLQRDARATWAELGREAGMSAPAVAERVRRLEAAGVITGYHAAVDLGALGLPLVAFVRMDADVPNAQRLGQTVAKIPEVLEFHQVTGGEGFILKVAVASVEQLGLVLARLLPFGRTTTSVVLSSPLTWRAIEPTAGTSDADGGWTAQNR